MELSDSQIEALRAHTLSRFKYFAMTLIPPEWFDEHLHADLCDFLQAEGSLDKLVILPRSFLKTSICAIAYPLWRATVDPTERILIVSNSATNAEKKVHAIRGIVESNPLYQALFPDRIPIFSKVRWSDNAAELVRPNHEDPEATFEAVGVNTNVIGRHCTTVIEDDTVAPRKDELTQTEFLPNRNDIEEAIGFHKLTLPMLVTQAVNRRIFICTRWAFYDCANFIMSEELVPKGRYTIFDRAAYNEDGVPTYKRYPANVLDSYRASLGPFMFSSLYLNNPLAAEHMSFNPGWVRYYTSDDELFKKAEEDGYVLVTVDPADPPTGKSTQCYSAIVTAMHSKHGIFVLSTQRGRWSELELINKTLDIAIEYKALRIRVEADRYANLEAGYRTALATRNKYVVIEAVKTRGRNKEARILRLSPLFEAGRIHLLRHMHELESELQQFPRGTTVDLLDALAWHITSDTPMLFSTESPSPEQATPGTFTYEEILSTLNLASEKRVPGYTCLPQPNQGLYPSRVGTPYVFSGVRR